MSTLDILMAAAGLSSSSIVVSDVFATALYTGNSSTQTINNGVNLAGNGGLVWVKARSNAYNNMIADTARGVTNLLYTNTADSNVAASNTVTSFNSSGFTLGSTITLNGSGVSFSSWTFRKAPKFFDIVAFTTDSSGNASFSHSLGLTPGIVIVKSLNSSGSWLVHHRSVTTNYALFLEGTTGQLNNGSSWISTSSSSVSITSSLFLQSAQYIAYLFAHDPSADGIIQCGSFTADSSGNASINLGYRPQFVLFKLTSTSSNWVITDSARGMPTGTGDKVLLANSNAAETTASVIDTSSTGFSLTGMSANATGIYMAIKSAV